MNKNQINNFVRDKIREDRWKEVEVGKIAQIMSLTKKGEEELFINADRVFVKCTHCGEIVNKTSKKKDLNSVTKLEEVGNGK